MKLQTHEEQIKELLNDLSLSPEEKKRELNKKRVATFRAKNPNLSAYKIDLDSEFREIIKQNKPENMSIKDFIQNSILESIKNSKK